MKIPIIGTITTMEGVYREITVKLKVVDSASFSQSAPVKFFLTIAKHPNIGNTCQTNIPEEPSCSWKNPPLFDDA